MDIFQTLATIALLTMLMYVVMVNVYDREHIPTSGNIETPQSNTLELFEGEELMPEQGAASGDVQAASAAPDEGPEAPNANYSTGKSVADEDIVGVNTNVGVFDRRALGEPMPNGNDNVTDLSVYNPEAEGVLPGNQDLYGSAMANFGSEITNIAQFYKLNPEIFEKSSTHVPNVADWNSRCKEMHLTQEQRPRAGPIEAHNYEDEYSLI